MYCQSAGLFPIQMDLILWLFSFHYTILLLWMFSFCQFFPDFSLSKGEKSVAPTCPLKFIDRYIVVVTLNVLHDAPLIIWLPLVFFVVS